MKQRERRHQVVVPARLRVCSKWADATILNLSNRGLMMHSTAWLKRGQVFELRRGSHVVVARVVWSNGSRHGARAQGLIPVADLIFDNPAPRALEVLADRRAEPRPEPAKATQSRQQGRRLEFLVVCAGIVSGAFVIVDAAYGLLSAPLRTVEMIFNFR